MKSAVSKAVCLDSGAGAHIMDFDSHRYRAETMQPADCVLEAVGQIVPIDTQAKVLLPSLRKDRYKKLWDDWTPTHNHPPQLESDAFGSPSHAM